jgi:O-antigen/teichoic acid export membrane protein
VKTVPSGRSGLRSRLGGAGARGLVARAGWSTVVEILQLLSSVLVFLIVAGLLTTDENGAIGTVMAVAIPMANLTSFGSHVLLIKRVAHGVALPDAWAQAMSIGVLGPAVGAVAALVLKPVLVPTVSWPVYTLLLIGQLNFFWLTELAVMIGNATRKLKEAAQIRLIVVVCRFAAVLVFWLFTPGELIDWAVLSFLSFGLSAGLAVIFVWGVLGAPPSLRAGSLAEVREGAPFSFNSVTESLVNMSDRPILRRFGPRGDDGIYFLGGRIIQFSYMPMRILMRASDADLFEAGKRGVAPALRLTRRLLVPGLGVALVVGVGAFVAAPIVPLLVGAKYDPAVDTIRWMAVMPVIRAVQYLMGNCLSASGKQSWRLTATAAAAVLNLVLNLIFIVPGGTWRTAVATTLVTEVFLTIFFVVVATTMAAREVPVDDAAPVGS